MKIPNPFKITILVIGDIIVLYAALLATLLIRYGLDFNEQFTSQHAGPFSLIFIIWILVFYIAGLYDLRRLRNNLDFLQTLSTTLAVNAFITIALFYLVPALGITPKTNLFIFIAIFALAESWWRHAFNRRASFREGLNRVLILDKSERAHELRETIASNPQIGYAVKLWMNPTELQSPEHLERLVREHGINLIVVPASFKHDETAARLLYELLALGIEVRDISSFYEIVFRKIPIREITESWFIEHAIGERRFYDDLKRGLELVGAIALIVLLVPLELLIALAVRLTSSGPAIYKQIRVGKHGNPFTLYKFRSMKALAPDGSAERNGAQWASTSDPRSTPIGKFLRASHLDELPQLINIAKGDLSFVGPRPERPEIVKKLVEEVPYYEIRSIIKPGITGWAQINYRYDQTTEDVIEKLSFDVYYLKHRSIILDLAIITKTLKSFFINYE